MRSLSNSFALFLTLILLTFSLLSQAADWRFTVFLDDDEIGYHNFSVKPNGATETVTIEAQFKVKFLLVTAFQYDHSNTEIWADGCLQKISSNTNDDGEEFWVNGELQGEQFVVTNKQGSTTLPGCVMSFAYWRADLIKQSKLLNSQTGEYLSVSIKDIGQDNITVRGKSVTANHYIITGKGFDDIELWYSADGYWQRLASTTENGYRITYELR